MDKLKIDIELGNLGTPAVKIDGADAFQTDDQIVEQLRLWAKVLGKDEIGKILDTLVKDRHPVAVLTQYLRKRQSRPPEGEGPKYDYPQPQHEGQWSFLQLVFALAMRFVAEDVHRPSALRYKGATYTSDHYKNEIDIKD